MFRSWCIAIENMLSLHNGFYNLLPVFDNLLPGTGTVLLELYYKSDRIDFSSGKTISKIYH